MGCKAAETTWSNNNAFGPGTANQCTVCSGGSRSSAKETRTLKMRRVMIGHQNLTTERITEANPLKTTGEVTEELNINHSMVVWHLKQTGKMKKLYKSVPHELTEKKIAVLKCHILLF